MITIQLLAITEVLDLKEVRDQKWGDISIAISFCSAIYNLVETGLSEKSTAKALKEDLLDHSLTCLAAN